MPHWTDRRGFLLALNETECSHAGAGVATGGRSTRMHALWHAERDAEDKQ